MKFNSKIVEELCGIIGVSGDETEVGDLICSEIEPYVDEVYTDALGNVIARKRGNGKKIMFAAHMDQIGMMITEITDRGFLKFTGVGGLIPFTLIGQQVILKNGCCGVINTEIDLENSKDYGKLSISNLYIDIGAISKEIAQKTVKVGDTAVFSNSYYEDESLVMSRALDDRIGCYVLMEAAKIDKKSDADVYYVFTVQEEVGTRGAKAAAYGIEPDYGIALDITPAGDVPGTKNSNVSFGKGVAIKIMDPSLVSHPKVRDLMIKAAEDNDVDYQREIMKRGGTDSGAIHMTKCGVPSGVISIPTRHAHTSNEIIFKSDVLKAIQLVNYVVDIL